MGDRHETVNRHSGIIRCACFLSFDWSSRWNDVLLKHPLPLPKGEPGVCCIAHLREQFYDQPALPDRCFFDGKCKKSRRIRPFVQNELADQAGRMYTLLGRGREMKYKLFQGWWVRFYFCCALMMSTIVGILVFAVWAGEDMILWDMGLAGLYAVLGLCMIFMQRRLLTYVVTEPSAFCAYSLTRRELCRIDLRQTVYYARFTTLASGCGKIPLIAISNEPFVYADYLGNIITRRRFIQGYDWKKVILMPYDERTKPLLDLDAWRCVR